MPPSDGSRARDIWIPVSDGSYVTESGDVCVVRSNFTGSVTVSTDSRGRRTVKEVGRHIIKEEIKQEEEEEKPALSPFTSLMRRSRTPPPRPPLPVTTAGRTPPPRPPPPRWVSPTSRQPELCAPQDPPPPYQGLIVREVPQDSPSPYGEVLLEQNPIGVRGNYLSVSLFYFLIFLMKVTYKCIIFFLVTARTSQGIYPELPPTPPALPSAPPADEGYGGSSGLSSDSSSSRGVVRPHSDSPFQRNVRSRTVSLQEEIDIEARGMATQSNKPMTTVSTFPASGASQEVMVKTFRTSTPKTPALAPRPERPPRIASRRILPIDTPRPRPLRSSPPSAAPRPDRRRRI